MKWIALIVALVALSMTVAVTANIPQQQQCAVDMDCQDVIVPSTVMQTTTTVEPTTSTLETTTTSSTTTTTLPWTCTDTDGGYFPLVLGTVTVTNGDTIINGVDHCTTAWILVEFSCNGNQMAANSVNCRTYTNDPAATCTDGACVSLTTTTTLESTTTTTVEETTTTTSAPVTTTTLQRSNGGHSGGGGYTAWTCAEWSACVNGNQTQVCTQGNNNATSTRVCNGTNVTTTTIPAASNPVVNPVTTTTHKPATTTSTTIAPLPSDNTTPTTENAPSSAWLYIGIGVVIIGIIAMIIFWPTKKK